jgi:Trk K+ transport system NAD-binding subunit
MYVVTKRRDTEPAKHSVPTVIRFRSTTGAASDAGDRATHFVLGGAHLGVAIAERLRADGHAVAVVDERSDPADVPVTRASPTDVERLTEAGLETASSVTVATRSDARNVLVAQLVRVHFDVPRTLVLVHDPERVPLLAEAGHEPVCVSTALSEMVGANA